ncbi:MAG: hypothetical protein K5776_07585 [Lachnospiraceae bacterium]|nr:hypothetical protein [Lachnospiraceae bacterium]
MKKNYLRLLTGLALLLTLTGCMRIERGLVIKSGGKMEVSMGGYMNQELTNMVYGSKEEFYEAEPEETEDMSENLGMSSMDALNGPDAVKTEFTADGTTWYGYQVKKNVSNFTEAADFFSDDNITFKISKAGLLTKTINIQMISMGNMSGSNSDMDYEDLSSVVNDTFYIEVPGTITSTDGTIDQNKKNRVSWSVADIDYGKSITKNMTVTYINVIPYIIIGVAVLLLVIILIIVLVAVIIFRKRRNDNKFTGVSLS